MKNMAKFKSISVKVSILILVICILPFFQETIINVKAQGYIDINVNQAYDMIQNKTAYPNLVILDVRSQEEYNSEHICNAILIPHDELESRIDDLNPYKNSEIIVYCRSGGRSQVASGILVSYNFTKVYNMGGGIIAWIAAGYDICTSENGQDTPDIDFAFYLFIAISLSSIIFLIFFYKKRLIRNLISKD